MAYERRMCVLKQIKKGFTADGGALSGVVYAERMGDLILTPRVCGLVPVQEGRYALVLAVGMKKYFFELRGNTPLRVPDAPALAGGFSVLIAFVRLNAEAEPVAFGRCGADPNTAAALLAALKGAPPVGETVSAPKAQDRQDAPPAPVPPARENAAPSEPPGVQKAQYEDEAIAAQNYFAPEGQMSQEGDDVSQKTLRRSPAYYESVREKLLAAFRDGGEDETLARAIPLSRWTKRGNALVGIVFEHGMPKYLCAAVPAEGNPPAAFQGKAVRVPVDFGNAAYYVLFQDAETGECVETVPN